MQKRNTLVEMIGEYFKPLEMGHYLTVNSFLRFLWLEFNWRAAEIDSNNGNSSTTGRRALSPRSRKLMLKIQYLKTLKVLEQTRSWVCFQGKIHFLK